MLLILGLLGTPVGEAHAQAPGAPAAVAPLITPPVPRVLPPAQPEIVPPAALPPEAAPPPPAGPPVRVDQVRIEGVTVYDEASLRALYADVVGATVPRARLDEIAQNLQARYRDDGYIRTLVRGEFQKSGDQVIFVIRAIEGYISQVKLDGDIGPAGELVLDMLERLTTKRPVKNAESLFEVRRILKAFVDGQWLADFDQRLAAYAALLAGDDPETAPAEENL